MNKLSAVAAAAALLAFSPAHAAEQILSAPGEGWHLRLDAPTLTPAAVNFGSVYSGRADRLQLSFFVAAPHCGGGSSKENIYNCFATAMKKSPLVVWETERGNTVPNGVQVMYMARLDPSPGAARSFNMHLLFARNGKWADVHASIASPTREDITMLAAVVNSIVIEDDAPAGQDAGK